MKNFKLLIILMIIINLPIYAHYHWVSVNNYKPMQDEKIAIIISSGHSFPKSGFLIGKKLIHKTRIVSSKKTIDFDIIKNKKNWVGNFKMQHSSMTYIEMILKKKYAKTPLYYARAVLFNKESHSENFTSFSIGKGLEIIPKNNLSLIKKKNTVKFQILLDGKPVKATIRIIRAGGGNAFIHSNNNGIIEYKFKKSGRYLLTTNYKKIGASLTFFIQNFKH